MMRISDLGTLLLQSPLMLMWMLLPRSGMPANRYDVPSRYKHSHVADALQPPELIDSIL